ncbi:MAG: hypothetical protein EXS31_15360 [Pedosphaera sp.]|nr:hypothetical protein [Pedosphaera sp.]
MKLHIVLLIAAATIIGGCKTTTTDSKSAGKGAGQSSKPAGKSVPLDPTAFSVVATTNQLDPRWLQSPTNFFRLGPGDVIDIETLGEATSRSSAVVGPDGKIYYGLLPGTFVWGLTLSDTKALLDQSLEKFFRDKPQTSITLRTVASQRIWVLGNVQAPGVYGLATPMTVLEAISLAGGTGSPSMIAGASPGAIVPTTGEADLRSSFVMRNGQPLGVDFERLFKRGDMSQNIYLQPDDFIYVRPSGGKFVTVLGAVPRGGFFPFTDRSTLLAVIAASGGTLRYAQVSQVIIIRGSLSNPTIAKVNYKAILTGAEPDLLIEEGDFVYVPFTPFKKIGEQVELGMRQFVSTIALNEGVRAVIRGSAPVGISVGSGAAAGK